MQCRKLPHCPRFKTGELGESPVAGAPGCCIFWPRIVSGWAVALVGEIGVVLWDGGISTSLSVEVEGIVFGNTAAAVITLVDGIGCAGRTCCGGGNFLWLLAAIGEEDTSMLTLALMGGL